MVALALQAFVFRQVGCRTERGESFKNRFTVVPFLDPTSKSEVYHQVTSKKIRDVKVSYMRSTVKTC
jgi:hypothetical protein